MLETSPLSRSRKVLWALDAFPEDPQVQTKAVRASRAFLQKIARTIEPIYVARPALPGLLVQAPVGLDESGVAIAKHHLKRFVKQVNLPQVGEPKFIFSEAASIGSMVKALLEYAAEHHFDLIVVGTHGRRGVARFFMGSFAEQLVLHSTIPVLVTNTKASPERAKAVKHLLFPTDFSEKSHEVFGQVVVMAREFKADLMIFHQLEFMYPEVTLPFIVPPVAVAAQEGVAEARRAEGEAWAADARAFGVKAKFHLCTKSSDAPSEIARAAKKLSSCVICMAAQSGQVESMLLGSVARQVLRSSPCPVYLVHLPARDSQVQDKEQREWLTHDRAVLG